MKNIIKEPKFGAQKFECGRCNSVFETDEYELVVWNVSHSSGFLGLRTTRIPTYHLNIGCLVCGWELSLDGGAVADRRRLA